MTRRYAYDVSVNEYLDGVVGDLQFNSDFGQAFSPPPVGCFSAYDVREAVLRGGGFDIPWIREAISNAFPSRAMTVAIEDVLAASGYMLPKWWGER